MSQNLPTGVFQPIRFTKKNETSLLKSFLNTPDQIKCGYLLECDLEYPSNLRKQINFHFFPDKKEQ